jgi:5-methylcytosine-specific restriction endonuclease McrA
MNKGTQFKRTPEGAKTERMLEVEKRIGRTLEEDYEENYLRGRLGQKRLANHWGVARNQVFGVLRGGRRNWVQMLGLPAKGGSSQAIARERTSRKCEICGATEVPLEGAHWLSARDGGSARLDNILRLCPNCHTRLDVMEHAPTIERARRVLLLRAAEAFLATTSARDEETQRAFFVLCQRIIAARQRSSS